jgi:hypothetical protein
VAGYTGTALAQKLGIKAGMTVALLDAPDGVITDLPSGVIVTTQRRGKCDVGVTFVTRRAKLEQQVERLGQMIFPNGGVWIAWPKKASGMMTDITDHAVRGVGLPLGLVDNKVCAIDDTWTGLRLVWRVDRRAEKSI